MVSNMERWQSLKESGLPALFVSWRHLYATKGGIHFAILNLSPWSLDVWQKSPLDLDFKHGFYPKALPALVWFALCCTTLQETLVAHRISQTCYILPLCFCNYRLCKCIDRTSAASLRTLCVFAFVFVKFRPTFGPNIVFGTGAVFAAIGGWVCEGLHWPKWFGWMSRNMALKKRFDWRSILKQPDSWSVFFTGRGAQKQSHCFFCCLIQWYQGCGAVKAILK